MKKILSLFLAILMVVSMFAVAGVVSAEEIGNLSQSTADEATTDEATKDETPATDDEEKVDILKDVFVKTFFADDEEARELADVKVLCENVSESGYDLCFVFSGYSLEEEGAAAVEGYLYKYYSAQRPYALGYYLINETEALTLEQACGEGIVTLKGDEGKVLREYLNALLLAVFENDSDTSMELYYSLMNYLAANNAYTEDVTMRFAGTVDEYNIALYNNSIGEGEYTETIGGFAYTVKGKSAPFGLGIYAANKNEVLTLKEAYDRGLDLAMVNPLLEDCGVSVCEAEPEEEPVFPSEPKPAGTNRYYFYLPEQWINDYAYTAGIYWWEGSISGDYWPGNEAKSAGVEGVYYYDIATDTPTIIWDNYLDGGMDSSSDIYNSALQTVDIPVSGSDYDGMIFVVNLSDEQINSFNNKVTYGGQWYYYYGSGQYGTAPTKAEAEEVFTNRSFGEWATPDETPTEPEEIPTNPVMPTTPVKPTKPVETTDPAESTAATEPVESVPVKTEPSGTSAATEASSTSPDATETTTKATEPTETTDSIGEWIPCLMGDADLNGKVNVKDATLIQKHAAHMFAFVGESEITADVNNDTNINVKDATVIQKYLAKIEVDFIVGEIVEIQVFPKEK